MIPVTKPYMPNRERLNKYIDGIYERHCLTNNGELVQELTRRLGKYLGVENLLLVANGTLALQVAYRVLGVSETNRTTSRLEVITTPFTFVATASSLKWDGVEPIFVDIDPATWCLNPRNIEAAITPNTRAIVPVHVFGNACDVEAIDSIARQHNLKVIYDGSHIFGTQYRGASLLNWGDATTLSFHATKLFHTGEGGAIVFSSRNDLDRAKQMINFGITGPETIESLGINAKMSELQAAMGLSVLEEIEGNLDERARIWQYYEEDLRGLVRYQTQYIDLVYNYAYAAVVFESEELTTRIERLLKEQGVSTRRYFYPSLASVECLGACSDQPVSRDIASRILCLPLFCGLRVEDQDLVIKVIKSELIK